MSLAGKRLEANAVAIALHTRLLAVLLLSIAPMNLLLADEAGSKTVIGPRNVALADGAQALLDGDAENGVRLTLRGLAMVQGQRERQAALSNLCAGYLMLGQIDEALAYCDKALADNDHNWRAHSNRALVYIELERFEDAEADVVRGQELAPNAKNLKIVRGLLMDQIQPVEPMIVIDDRRGSVDDET